MDLEVRMLLTVSEVENKLIWMRSISEAKIQYPGWWIVSSQIFGVQQSISDHFNRQRPALYIYSEFQIWSSGSRFRFPPVESNRYKNSFITTWFHFWTQARRGGSEYRGYSLGKACSVVDDIMMLFVLLLLMMVMVTLSTTISMVMFVPLIVLWWQSCWSYIQPTWSHGKAYKQHNMLRTFGVSW